MPDTILYNSGAGPFAASKLQVTPAGASTSVELANVINGGTIPQTLASPLIGGIPSASIANGITAGTTQTLAGAVALTAALNIVSTVGTANDAVKLPPIAINVGFAQVVEVFNNGASALAIFASESATAIDTHATNTAATLTTLHRATFIQNTNSTWVSKASVSAAS